MRKDEKSTSSSTPKKELRFTIFTASYRLCDNTGGALFVEECSP